ncbi:hypothetical protein V2S66_05670 [Streptomyces sp. V4-01]|uniref:Uncharacterized protein n=1 Tax=Actinacidiphila polyblastidii TaxID=3110430 RepID=A0ABU7P6L4_9ACTN|nr:hypothetical protein [Streptomyces sp. V4-01]
MGGSAQDTGELSRSFMAAVGSRQTVAVLLPVRLAAEPPWTPGPFPFPVTDGVADTAARSRLFTPASARALYGQRWHTRGAAERDGWRLDAMELLRTPSARSPHRALAVLHFTVSGTPLLPALRAISGRAGSAGADPLTGALEPAALLSGVASTDPPASPFAPARPYTVAFLAPDAATGAALRDDGPMGGELPASADLLLRSLASRATPADIPLPAERLAGLRSGAVRMSADWSALVLRQGAAFLGHRPDTGPGDFYDHAAVGARGVHLDAILLGTVQRDLIEELTDDLSEVFTGPGVTLTRRVGALERRIAVFRSAYWRQHLDAHGPANEVLLAFQARHRLPERFAQILAEAADYARLAQTQESQQIAAALGLLTILGLPVSTALGILQVLGDTAPRDLVLALTAALATAGAALLTRYGRLVIGSLRG